MNSWEFVCRWYTADEIERSIKASFERPDGWTMHQPPLDVRSREFAEWLTEQYRLAMNKGIEIGRSETVKEVARHAGSA